MIATSVSFPAPTETTTLRIVRKPKKKAGRRKAHKCPCCGQSHGDNSIWFNKSRGWSYCYLTPDKKKSHRLLVKTTDPKDIVAHDKALALFADIARKPSQPIINPMMTAKGEAVSVEYLVGLRFERLEELAEARRQKGKKTWKRKLDEQQALLNDFLSFVPRGLGKSFRAMTVGDLRLLGHEAVLEWAKAHKAWGASTKALNLQQVKSCFCNVPQRLQVASNPIAGLKTNVHKIAPRFGLFSPAQEKAILENCSPEFGSIFQFLLASGCRPDEACTLTFADVKSDENGLYLWIMHKNFSKKNSRRRVVLTGTMKKVIAELIVARPSGSLFRSPKGTAWTPAKLLKALRSVCKRDTCKALGLENRLSEETYEFVIYTTRHTFAHRWLTGFYGIEKNCEQVAELMGNSAKEVERTYGKIARNRPFVERGMDSL